MLSQVTQEQQEQQGEVQQQQEQQQPEQDAATAAAPAQPRQLRRDIGLPTPAQLQPAVKLHAPMWAHAMPRFTKKRVNPD